MPKKEQISVLQTIPKNHPLMTILRYSCDPRLKFLLPEGTTPYTPSNIGDDNSVLPGELRRLYLFVEGGHPTLKQTRREALWVEMLQFVHPDDAKLLDLIKDKKLPEGLDVTTVKKAIPSIFE